MTVEHFDLNLLTCKRWVSSIMTWMRQVIKQDTMLLFNLFFFNRKEKLMKFERGVIDLFYVLIAEPCSGLNCVLLQKTCPSPNSQYL